MMRWANGKSVLSTVSCKDVCHGRSDGGHESCVEHHQWLLRHAAMEEAEHPLVPGKTRLEVRPGILAVIGVDLAHGYDGFRYSG